MDPKTLQRLHELKAAIRDALAEIEEILANDVSEQAPPITLKNYKNFGRDKYEEEADADHGR